MQKNAITLKERVNEVQIKELKAKLKDSPPRGLYLFLGEEDFLKRRYQSIIREKLAVTAEEFNLLSIKNEKPDLAAIHAFIESPPFASESKLLLIKNSGIFKQAAEDQKSFWTHAFPSLPDYLCLVFCEEQADKRSVLYKAADKNGTVVTFDLQDTDSLCSFVLLEAKKFGKTLSRDTALYLIERSGDNLEAITSELDKLVSYCDGPEISKSAIDEVVSQALTNRVFELTDAAMNQKSAEALKIVQELIELKEPYQRVSYLIFQSFEKLYKTRVLSDKKMQLPAIAAETGLKPFIVKKYLTLSRHFSPDVLRKIMMSFAETDLRLRNGIGDEWMALEEFIIKISMKS